VRLNGSAGGQVGRQGTEPAREYKFSYGISNVNHELDTGFFVHKKLMSAVTRVDYISDRMPYIILRGR
jgi:hypothetical protein